jgi:malonyl-CoA/methylmalonyl-CoA synthetase
MSANVFELVRRACATPDKHFVEAEGRRFTCGDALAWTGRLANILVLSDVEPGDTVAVQAEKTPEHLLLYLAVLRAGAVYLPLDASLPLNELDNVLGAAKPKLVVCDPARRDALALIAEKHRVSAVQTLDANGGGLLMQAAAKAPSEFADVPRESDDVAVARPAKLTHGELTARAKPLIVEGRFMQLL